MGDNGTVDTVRKDGPGSLGDIAAEHAAMSEAGRPRAADDLSTPEGRAKAAKRERDRARYAAKSGLPKKSHVGAVSAAPAADLFKPETCAVLVRLPFDAAAAWLKSESWALDKSEADLLAPPCAETLNQFFPETSPKWAAATAFGLSLLTIVTKKYLMWQEEKKSKEGGNEH